MVRAMANWSDCGLSGKVINPETIIPRPQIIEFYSCDIVNIDSSWKIFADLSTEDNFTAIYLSNKSQQKFSLSFQAQDLSNLEPNKRIVIGNPNTNSVIAQLSYNNNIDINSILNKGFNQGYVLLIKPNEILVFANSTSGTFYGIVTLINLMNTSGSGIVFPNIKITDWPDFKYRFFYGGGSWYPTQEDWIENLTMMKYNSWIGYLSSLGPSPSVSSINRMLARINLLKQRHFFTTVALTPISVRGYNANLHEGIWSQNISLRFNRSDIAELNETDFSINNSDFELDSDSDGIPDYWSQTINNSENYWYVDCTNAASGTCSMKLNLSYNLAGTSSSAYLRTQNYPIKPNKVYQYSVWAKKNAQNTKPQTQVTFVIQNQTSYLRTSSVVFEDNINLWKKYTNSFSSYSGEKYVYVYSRAQSTDALELWIDGLSIPEVDNKLFNIIETNDTTIEVWDENKTVKYIKDTDYTITNSGILNASGPWNGKKTIISRIPSGVIPANSKILVDYDFLPRMQQDSPEYISLSDPLVLDTFKWDIVNQTLSNINPDFVFIALDEIRGVNRDSRAKKRGFENYQILAYFIENVTKIIHSYNSNINVIMWDDMVSPFHNGGDEDYQVYYGGQKGKTWHALDLLNRNLTMIAWWYGAKDYLNTITTAPELYNEYGFNFFAGPWNEPQNIRWWSYISYKHNAIGFIEHEYYDDIEDIPAAANYSWNAIKTYAEQCNPDYIEICDGIDNDCDNSYWFNSYTEKVWPTNIDENFNLSKDPFNCGSCGNICYYKNSLSSCDNGICRFDGCFRYYYDVNNNLADGCECSLTNNGTEICDSVDNNCDGVVDEACTSNNPDDDGGNTGGGSNGGGGSPTTKKNDTNASSGNQDGGSGDIGGERDKDLIQNQSESDRESLDGKDKPAMINSQILIYGIIIVLVIGITLVLIGIVVARRRNLSKGYITSQ